MVEGLAQVPYIGWLLPKVRTSATEDPPLIATDDVPYIGWLLPKVRTSATEDAPLVATDDPDAECIECASDCL